jgi:hypothetical protein
MKMKQSKKTDVVLFSTNGQHLTKNKIKMLLTIFRHASTNVTKFETIIMNQNLFNKKNGYVFKICFLFVLP